MRGRAIGVAVLMMLAGCGGDSSESAPDEEVLKAFPPAILTAVERAELIPQDDPTQEETALPDLAACRTSGDMCEGLLVVTEVCAEGGYDLTPASERTITLWSFPARVPWAEEVRAAYEDDDVFPKDEMEAKVVEDAGVVRCVYIVIPEDDPDGEDYAPGVWEAPPRS